MQGNSIAALPYKASVNHPSTFLKFQKITPSTALQAVPILPSTTSTDGLNSPQPLEGYTNEQLEQIRTRKQRARYYEDNRSLKANLDYTPRTSATPHFPPSVASVPPLQPKYTYQIESGPIYKNDRSQLPVTSTPPPPSPAPFTQAFHQSLPSSSSVVDTRNPLLHRGAELRSSRKSVTFDANIESVALHSPLETPSRPTDYSRHTAIRVETHSMPRFNKPAASMKSIPIHQQTVNQPENAESLSFKDKMAFFAKQIGEDLPKNRYKASQRERQIMNDLTR